MSHPANRDTPHSLSFITFLLPFANHQPTQIRPQSADSACPKPLAFVCYALNQSNVIRVHTETAFVHQSMLTMTDVFIIQNQHHQFLDKHGTWVESGDSAQLYRTAHRDEAINIKVEHSVRDPNLRLSIRPCRLDAKGRLQIMADIEHSSVDREAKDRFTQSIDANAEVSIHTQESTSATLTN